MQFIVEYTDTFGGEANYSWLRRKFIEIDPKASGIELQAAAKEAVDLVGRKGEWQVAGDTWCFRPRGAHTILMVFPK